MTRGLLLFAHGARDARWAAPFEAVVRRIGELDPQRPVALAFLEFMTPDLHDAGSALVAQGCIEVDVVPLFLGAGGHVRKDVPILLEALAAAHQRVRWTLKTAIGEHPGLVEAMARAAME